MVFRSEHVLFISVFSFQESYKSRCQNAAVAIETSWRHMQQNQKGVEKSSKNFEHGKNSGNKTHLCNPRRKLRIPGNVAKHSGDSLATAVSQPCEILLNSS